MSSGLWPAVSGATARSQAVDTVANNLANMDTSGFKKDVLSFQDYMATLEREGIPDAPTMHRPIKDKDLYPLDGKDQSFVAVRGSFTHFKQGPMKVTQNPLDVALEGPGFLEVGTPEGVRYTRQGSLKLTKDGRLVTQDGFPVLASTPGGLAAQPTPTVQPDQEGLSTQGRVGAEPSIDARIINLRDQTGALSISDQGEVYMGDKLIAKLSVQEFKNPQLLKKTRSLFFENKGGAENAATTPSQTRVIQGMIEGSNVNPVEEMTNLIKANRLFEHDLKSIKTYNEMMAKESNEIGKL